MSVTTTGTQTLGKGLAHKQKKLSPQGWNSDTGENGRDGQNGLNGLNGLNGQNGQNGEKGDKGEKGEKGDKGDTVLVPAPAPNAAVGMDVGGLAAIGVGLVGASASVIGSTSIDPSKTADFVVVAFLSVSIVWGAFGASVALCSSLDKQAATAMRGLIIASAVSFGFGALTLPFSRFPTEVHRHGVFIAIFVTAVVFGAGVLAFVGRRMTHRSESIPKMAA